MQLASSLARIAVPCPSRMAGTGRPKRAARQATAPARAAKNEGLTGVVFQPFEEVQGELAVVQRASAAGNESLARAGYEEELEAAVNDQINVELNNSYVYHALASYMDRDNVALTGFAKYFREQAHEETGHAEKLMDHQNRRGGRVQLKTILAPAMMDFDHEDKGEALWSMELALALEKLNFHKLRALHAIADRTGDAEFTSWLEDEMLREQAQDVKTAANYVAMLRRVGRGHGVWHFDRYLADGDGDLNGLAA